MIWKVITNQNDEKLEIEHLVMLNAFTLPQTPSQLNTSQIQS